MTTQVTTLDLVIAALLKLDPISGERQNLLAFIQSCYGGCVRCYDFDQAVASLSKLTAQEHRVLIEYVR